MILDFTPSEKQPVFPMCWELPGFEWTTSYGLCWHCEKPTVWVEHSFNAHLHPGRCSQAKWDQRAWNETFLLIEEWRRGHGL